VRTAVLCYVKPKLGPPPISKDERAGVTNAQVALMVLKSLVLPMIFTLGVLVPHSSNVSRLDRHRPHLVSSLFVRR